MAVAAFVVLFSVSCGTPTTAKQTNPSATTSSTGAASTPRTTGESPSPSRLPCPSCPPVRSDSGSTFDASRGSIVVFGGFAYRPNVTQLAETWEWSAGSWIQLHPAVSPSPRDDPAMAFVPDSGVLLYGGQDVADSGHPVNTGEGRIVNLAVDTWKWDGTSWREFHPVHSPQLWVPAMAYDANRHQVVLYGPDRSGGGWQTWTWDGNDWSLHSGPTASPDPGRSVGGTIGYDQAIGEVVLFGGFNHGSFDQTAVWGWDGSRWTNLPALRAPNIPALTIAAEPSSGRAVIYAKDVGASSTTWAWNGTGWSDVTTQTQPEVILGSRLFPDPPGHRLVLFGEVATGSDSWYEVWAWSGSSWVQLG